MGIEEIRNQLKKRKNEINENKYKEVIKNVN